MQDQIFSKAYLYESSCHDGDQLWGPMLKSWGFNLLETTALQTLHLARSMVPSSNIYVVNKCNNELKLRMQQMYMSW